MAELCGDNTAIFVIFVVFSTEIPFFVVSINSDWVRGTYESAHPITTEHVPERWLPCGAVGRECVPVG